jgi:hypothetical protein
MDKSTIENIIREELASILGEAKVSAGDNDFNLDVSVNRNPTKEGIKIQFKPAIGTDMSNDEKAEVTLAIQEKLNSTLEPLGLQVSEDPDIKQATDNPNVIGFYIPIAQIKNMIVNAMEGETTEG